MSWYQLRQWQRYFEIEPFGEEREDLRVGMVAACVSNGISAIMASKAGKRDYETVSASDFILRFDQMQDGEDEDSEDEEERLVSDWQEFKESLTKD